MRKDGSNLSHVSLEEDESNSVPNSPVKAGRDDIHLYLGENKTLVTRSVSAEAAAAASALPVAPPTPRSPVYLSHVVSSQVPSSQSHPDEFSYAFGYVTKVKNRFQEQPHTYRKFLEILKTYKNEQRNLKEGDGPGRESAGNKQMTAAEVYSQVAKLFVDHDDLLAEFVRFMPDTSNHQTKQACPCEETSTSNRKPAENEKESSTFNNNMSAVSMGSAPPAKMGLKRSSSMTLDHNSPSTSQDATYHPPANKNKRSKPSRRFSL
ncbi:paired amphipathic helix protein Sin3a-like [Homalodisca vitripennis]|uniref:paired amphipathic helix protein Sin3a-like n=1 Tax=Homalodisca vitripennis TaxID=197043 RepID=UPI001EECBC5F|nr:paired amphipathic helix protein Sin3a-like [Homalodisca vitripennis]